MEFKMICIDLFLMYVYIYTIHVIILKTQISYIESTF